MTNMEKIPTEVIQMFSPQQAWDYMLLPYRVNGGMFCYGLEGKDYSFIEEEILALYGYTVSVETLKREELIKFLSLYYRQSAVEDSKRYAGGMEFLRKIINEAYGTNASDIHFEPGNERCRIRFRIDGKLMERYILGKGEYASLANQIKIAANLDISEKRLPQDGRIMYNVMEKRFDIRVSSLPTIYGEKIVLRLLTRDEKLLDITNLGFSTRQLEDYLGCVKQPHGMVLITGPTGSGKSTTLYATLRYLSNDTNNIVTIEDPVEYTLKGINQVHLKEEIGLTFSNALRTFLRQDPDIIMLGEIRDSDTAQMAVRSSLTGHLILSTIHTNDAYGAVARLADMGVHPYLISNTLLLCVAQRLVRILCSHCKNGNLPVGCSKCYYTGYKGRKAIYEVIPVDAKIRDAIRNNHSDISDILARKGITTLKDAAMAMYMNNETSEEEIFPIMHKT